MGLIGPAPLIPKILKTMPQFDPGEITLMTMSSFNFFVALSALFGGVLLDKLGVIKVFIAGMILVAAGALLMPVCGNSLWGMIFNRGLQGCGTGPIMASAAPLAAAYFPQKERSIVTGFQGFSVALGIVAGLLFLPQMAVSLANWQKALMFIGPLGIVGIVLAITIMFGPKALEVIVEKTAEEHQTAISHAFKKAIGEPVLWVAILTYLAMSWVFQAFNDMTPGYIGVPIAEHVGSLGMGTIKGGKYLILATILYCIGSIVGGVITDKVFKGNGRPVIATGFLLGAISAFMILVPFVTSNPSMLVFFLSCCGFFFSFVNPQAVGYIAKNYPKEITGKLGGMATGIAIFGGWGGATAGGYLIHASGYPGSIHVNVIGFCLVGFIISLFLRPKKTNRRNGLPSSR